MFFLVNKFPSYLKLIITTRFYIFIYYFGIYIYKCSYHNFLMFQKQFYFFNLNNQSFFSFKNILLRFFNYSYYGNSILMHLIGIGFRVILENNILFFRIGYSNFIKIQIPFNICVKCVSKTDLLLFSFDFCLLTQFCSILYKLRKNNIYKNYGIYYNSEIINLKKIKTKKETV